MRKPIQEHKPWPGKVYTYFIVDDTGHVVEGNLPSEETARIVIDFLKSENAIGIYSIEVEQVRLRK